MTDLIAAALARRSNVRAAADRPTHRRCAEAPSAPAVVRAAVRDLALREPSAENGLIGFTGHASVTEQGYEMWDYYGPYTEVISADAFDATLAQVDLDVPLVIAHDQTRRVARTTNGTLRLSVDEVGLLVDADLDPADVDVAYIVPKLRAGLIDEMSFAFRITKGVWSPDFSQFRIEAVDIHRGDTAIVGYGANPYTDSGVRADAPAERVAVADPEIVEIAPANEPDATENLAQVVTTEWAFDVI